MAIQAINPFAPSDLETEQFVGWETALSDRETAMKTSLLRLFNIGAAVTSFTVEVEELEATPTTGKIGVWNDTATTSLPVKATLTALLTNYSVLKIEDELVVVKSVNRTSNTIEVFQRGHGGTTASAHIDETDAIITGYNYVVGVKNIESRVAESETHQYFVAKQSVPSVAFTKEDLTIRRKNFGEDGSMNYVEAQIDRMDKNLLIEMDKSLVYHSGQKAANGNPGMIVGLISEALTRGNVVTSFGTISSTEKINDALTASRNKGGFSDFIMVGSDNFDAIQALANDETQVNVPDRLQVVLGASVSAIETKVGRLIPILNLNFPADKFVVGNSADLFWAPLAGFETPGADRTIAQDSTRNDQAFTVDTLTQGTTYYFNSNKNLTIATGVTQS